MAQMLRVTVNWTGFIGAPGYTNLYFRDFAAGDQTQAIADGSVAKVDTWLNAWIPSLPAAVTVGVDPSVEVIEDTTGQLQGFFNTTPEAAQPGTSAGNYAAPTGGVVNWYTNGIRNGRRVRGRSFMVPLGPTAFALDGTLATTVLTTLRTATQTMIDAAGAGDIGVWSRPTVAAPASGAWHAVSSFTIPDKAAILSSRRD